MENVASNITFDPNFVEFFFFGGSFLFFSFLFVLELRKKKNQG